MPASKQASAYMHQSYKYQNNYYLAIILLTASARRMRVPSLFLLVAFLVTFVAGSPAPKPKPQYYGAPGGYYAPAPAPYGGYGHPYGGYGGGYGYGR
jgi:hypothetical protein